MTDRDKELYQLAIEIVFYMNTIAQQRKYSTTESCVSYMHSTVAQWKSEATVFSAWRDSCWTIISPIIDALQPTDPVPTIDELVATLPPIVWP